MEVIKNCDTCGHAKVDKCLLTGYYCTTQRKYPAPPCDVNLSGWIAKQKTLKDEFRELIHHLWSKI